MKTYIRNTWDFTEVVLITIFIVLFIGASLVVSSVYDFFCVKIVQYFTLAIGGWVVIMFGTDALGIDNIIDLIVGVVYVSFLTERYWKYIDNPSEN